MQADEKLVLNAMVKEGKPMRPGEVAEVSGLDKDAVAKAIKNLKEMGLIDSPRRCFYAPVQK